jgi:hypothetical protein
MKKECNLFKFRRETKDEEEIRLEEDIFRKEESQTVDLVRQLIKKKQK